MMTAPIPPADCVAVVGATGAAGSTLLRVLGERDLPLRSIRVLASARGAGSRVSFRGRSLTVAAVDENGLLGADVVFFAAGAAVARQFAPLVARAGGVAVDKSSAYRLDPAVPLVVPEVNGGLIEGEPGIIANPNCVAVPLVVALAPLHRAFGLRHLTVATYQAASGGGRELLDELDAQVLATAAGVDPQHHRYPHVLHGNVVPGGWPMEGDDTEEERKVVAETRRVLDLPELAVSITTVRVPVRVGHSMAVWAEFDHPAGVVAARELLEAAAGVRVVDDPAQQIYPTPLGVAGTDDVQVGRLREDAGRPGGLAMFLAVDNLRKGAATNAVQVAELWLRQRG